MPTDFNATRLAWDLVAVLLLICVTAFFALAEYALITVRKTRIRQLVEEGDRAALHVERMLEHPTRMMATIQTGITLVATVSSAFAATSAVAPIAVWLQARGMTGGIAT
ncbi:MAG TPA: CNNM domain-containing protein, partial [Chthonomonadaceae bacterium]|nr:CNNM domain-containing protein [Chthonomonadaceae bacterium]